MKALKRPGTGRVIVAPLDHRKRSDDGKYLLSDAGLALVGAEAPNPVGIIMAVGRGELRKDGTERPIDVQVGDVVVYRRDTASFIFEGMRVSLCNDHDVLAVVESGAGWRICHTTFDDGAWTTTVTYRPMLKTLPPLSVQA